jgi:hypothetical protein
MKNRINFIELENHLNEWFGHDWNNQSSTQILAMTMSLLGKVGVEILSEEDMQNKMDKLFVKRISTGIIYQVFEIDGSVIRVYNNITGEYVGQDFLRSEVELLLTEEDLKNESELNALENQSNEC